eukprot:5988861-Amphidinium_carterae.1
MSKADWYPTSQSAQWNEHLKQHAETHATREVEFPNGGLKPFSALRVKGKVEGRCSVLWGPSDILSVPQSPPSAAHAQCPTQQPLKQNTSKPNE